MNKGDLIACVADRAGLSKKDAEAVVGTVLGCVEEALVRGEKVQLIGFGTFEVRERASRDGRNPKTGASLRIPASKTPAFKAGKALKDKVNG